MSTGSSVPYRLRPNKAVDRELFLSLLTRLAPKLSLENYHYIGLGGAFLEDFRLVHSRVGIGRKKGNSRKKLGRMTCVEAEEAVHKRQRFNRPIASIECVHSTLEQYLDESEFKTPTIIWLDYTEPQGLAAQIERFAQTVGEVALNSVLRITLNASPASLGKPSQHLAEEELWAWRLETFKNRLGALFPSELSADGMSTKSYGRSVLRALYLAAQKEILSHKDRQLVWALATHYADGQPMVTATLVVCAANDSSVAEIVKGWEFYSTTDAPHRIDLPALSSLERLVMESVPSPRRRMGFELPTSVMGEDPFAVFKKFYRIYPHFSRVEL